MHTSNIAAAKKIAQLAGDTLIKHYGNVEISHIKSDLAADVVTKLDTDIEMFIADALEKHDASIGFRGEEFGERKNSNKYWLVDPIDGTAHFVRGIPYCTRMIALIDNGEVVLSVIYNFVTKELFEAEKGKGTKLNGKTIHVSNRTLKDAYLSVESNLSTPQNVETFLALKKKSIFFHTVNCGYEYGLVASGKIDGRICLNPFGKDWDFAPGSLLVSEAGGIVKNIGKSSYDYQNHDFLAVNKEVYKELTEGNEAQFPIVNNNSTKK